MGGGGFRINTATCWRSGGTSDAIFIVNNWSRTGCGHLWLDDKTVNHLPYTISVPGDVRGPVFLILGINKSAQLNHTVIGRDMHISELIHGFFLEILLDATRDFLVVLVATGTAVTACLTASQTRQADDCAKADS